MPNLNGTFMLYSIIAALILNVTQRLEVSCTPGFMEQDKKIAFLFLARRHMPLEDIWKEFFGWKANSSHYTIYVHPEQGFKYHNTSFFYGREIQSVHNVKWGGMSQVRAIKNLVKEALKDPLNEWFCLMSESCIPLHPFPVWRKAFAIQEKSIVNACAMSHGVMETETRWRPSLDDVGMVKSQWRKSATWFALNRNHSMVFANEIHLEKGWESVPCCDEHYLPSILAYNNLDSETTCSDGFAHVKWDSPIDSHPHSYRNHEISKESFIQFESQSAEGEGFNHKCSGNPKICHFTARKFNANTKYPLLEKINLMLDDNSTGLVYDGDQWEQFHKKLRIRNINENEIENEVYYLIDGGSLRLIPDMFTLEHMHLNVSLGKVLTQHEMLMFPFGASYPSRKNGQIVKASRMNSIYLIEDGSRREFPTFSTFVSMGYTVSNVTLVTENDLEQIPIGLTLPTL